MAKAINILFAAALAAAALASAVSLAKVASSMDRGDATVCAERLCSVVFF